jgi:hypothetical protein
MIRVDEIGAFMSKSSIQLEAKQLDLGHEVARLIEVRLDKIRYDKILIC